jgi:Zn-dependent protease
MTFGAAHASADAIRCGCGTEVAAGVLACPGCHRLMYADLLKQYQEQAAMAAAASDVPAEIAAWRLAVALLPPGSRQHTAISQKIAALSEAAIETPAHEHGNSGWKWMGGLGTAGLVAWKLKFLFVALLTKGKLLFLGLTKAGTVFSMILSFGVYWTAWGMWFALGIVLSIYVHEMGHVAALRRFGVQATAPMFVPGLGAFIRMRAHGLSRKEDARIGLAGPLWGLGAAGVAMAVASSGGGPMWMAIARTGAWLNAFNLLPVWQLDGSRGLVALSKSDRLVVAAAFAAGWAIAGDGLFVLLALTTAGRAFLEEAIETSDRRVLGLFVFLIVALAVVFRAASAGAAPVVQ